MTEKELQYTKRKLTFHFVGIVFLMAFFIEVVFLSFRFFHERHEDTTEFKHESEQIIESLNREDLFDFLNLKGFEKVKDIQERRKDLRESSENLISYFVINPENEIIRKSIKEDIDVEVFLEGFIPGIYVRDNALLRKENIDLFYEPATIYLYKKYSYTFTNYVADVSAFLILTLLFSVVFYIVGYYYVNRILHPVEQNLQDMTDFIHNASHELKTPLAIMRGNLQVMQAEKKIDETLVRKNIRKIDRLTELIEWLRELAEAWKLSEKENLALAIEVSRVKRDLTPIADARDIKIDNQVKGTYIVHANIQALHVLLTNIIKNAIIYSKKWAVVKITLHKNTLSITDTGKWISDKEKEKIFERFYRWNKVRNEDGFGIGLSLVKKIADANGWEIRVESKQWEWTTFQIVF